MELTGSGVLCILKGVFAKNKAYVEKLWMVIFLLSVVSIRRKLLKTTHTVESNVHTNSESCNIQLRS